MINQYRQELLDAITHSDYLRFDKQHPWHRNLIALYCCLIEYSESLIFLIESKTNIAIPTVFRSLLESFVEFKNLAEDRTYGNHMEANYHEQWLKIYNEAIHGNNDYLSSFSENPAIIESQIEEHQSKLNKLKESGFHPINLFQKFDKAGMVQEYRSIYNYLCSHSHNNIRSFVGNFFEIDFEDHDFQISMFKEFDISEYEKYILSGKNYLKNGSYNIHSLLDSGYSHKFQMEQKNYPTN